MAQRVSHVKVALTGLLAGGLFGVSQGLLHGNLWLGLGMGVLFGGGMALLMRRVWGSTALKGLDRGQRRAVSRAMRRGEPVDDPRLARPLVDQVDAVLAMPYPATVLRVVFVLLGLFGLLVIVLDSLDEGRLEIGGGAMLVVVSLLMLSIVPLGLRQRERFRRSQDATRQRHRLS
ncbi:hypothetical protein AB0G02_41165, partial [Actinosynnema sp. NPDC023658]|uniref:hypothetical protein n=1 Tax=Actinosynnema sp. NPDC023658 TaxID=3155465 RepID=UPI003411DB57